MNSLELGTFPTLPPYYRQVKYNQHSNKPPNPEKIKRKEQRAEKHKEIFLENKEQSAYYDPEIDQYQKAQYYSKILNLESYQSLHQLLSNTFRHARRRENIFPIVDRQPDHTLKCVYSGIVLSDEFGNMLQKCDEEHSFPQSFQRGTKSGTGRDMHAIFAASKHANGSRGNTPFGIYSEEQRPIRINECGVTYSGKPKKTYVPKYNSGAVARSTLYILVCYKNCAHPGYLPKQTLPWLIQQASSTEVTLWEKHRNQILYELQGNRNPFIDFPKLAKTLDFTQGWQKKIE